MKLVYFAWVRERIGRADEEADPPPGVSTVSELIGWLAERGPEYAHAFEARDAIRAAVDKRHARPNSPLAGATEVAFFPPMTGG